MNEKTFFSFFCRRRAQPSQNLHGYEFKKFGNKMKSELKNSQNKIKISRLFFKWLFFANHNTNIRKYLVFISSHNKKKLKKEYFVRFLFYYYNYYVNTCIHYNDCLLNTFKEWENEKNTKLSYFIKLFLKEELNKKLEIQLNDIECQLNCCICFQNRRNVLFCPCNHAVCCKECSIRVDRCPICKSEIKSSIKFFL